MRVVASGFDAPVYVTAPRRSRARALYVVEQPGGSASLANGKLRRSRSSTSAAASRQRRRAGAALGRVPPELREEPPLLRRLHRHERRHARRRVPLERHVSADDGPRASCCFVRPAVREPQRRPAPVRARRQALRRHGRRRLGRRSAATTAQNLARSSASCCASNVDKRGARWQIVGLRPAQPVALLVRSRDRRPLHRRRRPERVGGDRLRGRAAAPALRTSAGHVYEGTHEVLKDGRSTRAGRSSSRSYATAHDDGCSVTGGYVYRGTAVPAAAAVTSTATTARARSGASLVRRKAPASGASRSRSRASRRSARTPPASSTSSRSTARSISLASETAQLPAHELARRPSAASEPSTSGGPWPSSPSAARALSRETPAATPFSANADGARCRRAPSASPRPRASQRARSASGPVAVIGAPRSVGTPLPRARRGPSTLVQLDAMRRAIAPGAPQRLRVAEDGVEVDLRATFTRTGATRRPSADADRIADRRRTSSGTRAGRGTKCWWISSVDGVGDAEHERAGSSRPERPEQRAAEHGVLRHVRELAQEEVPAPRPVPRSGSTRTRRSAPPRATTGSQARTARTSHRRP